MDDAFVLRVRERAKDRCKYCCLPRTATVTPFQVDHIVARAHGGGRVLINSAYSCIYCNRFKGPNLSGIDNETGKAVGLFNPRRHTWSRHFRWDGPVLVGKTPRGRATIAVLQINNPRPVALRAALMEEGVFPPA